MVEKPKSYQFTPGQATLVAINQKGWQEKSRPFSFTSLNEDLILEFIIKAYPKHQGVSQKIHQLKPKDELIIENPWGAICYQGPGVFLAAGTGITPFIAIFRQLKKENKIKGNRLIFSNKTARDIILEKDLKEIFGRQAIFTLTREKKADYQFGRINKNFLKKQIKDFSQNFYLCGPQKFIQNMKDSLATFGAKTNSVITEK